MYYRTQKQAHPKAQRGYGSQWKVGNISKLKSAGLTAYITLSETIYHWRKIEPVTMKANFIHFWCVESEFMIKNWFHNWTSELGCIWHIFGKFRLFLALFGKSWYSSNCQHHCQQGSVKDSCPWLSWFAAAGCCQCWSAWKEPNFPKMCQMHPNSDVQLWN